MNIKRLTIRLNLDNDEDKLAYEKLQSIDKTKYKSVNSFVISAINNSDRDYLEDMRAIIREELQSVSFTTTTAPNTSEENDRMVLEDLEMFM